jgi:hypothetical protein
MDAISKKEYNAAYYRANKEKRKECSRSWRIKNMGRFMQKSKEWAKANPKRIKDIQARSYGRQRKAHLMDKYGISDRDYSLLMESQRGVCKICSKICASGRALSVDHDHATGRVRGLLCGKCNAGLGLFMDSKTNLELAIKYLNNSYPVIEKMEISMKIDEELPQNT